MALTEVPIELSSAPGIVDNSTGTAITIDASSNVGIGVSPGEALDINRATSTASYARVGNGGNVQAYIGVAADNLPVLGSYTNHDLRMVVNALEVARFDTSGNLGIGTDSPNAALDILGATSDQLRLRTAETEEYQIGRNASTGFLDFYGSQTGFTGYTFGGVDGERMRIDASGNLLVGKTAAGSDTVGFQVLSTGKIAATVSGDETARFNRTTSDGDIVEFRKDDTTVGSIGTTSGYTKIVGGDGTNGSGLLFSDIKLYPVNAAGNISDATIDVGVSNYRFKDLYLSGKTYLNTSSGAQLVLQTDATRGFIGTSTSHDLVLETAGSEAMRIDSTGAVIVNNSGGDAQIYLGGSSGTSRMYLARTGTAAALWNVDNGVMQFGTNNAEAMRIDASGNLLVGTNNVAVDLYTPNANVITDAAFGINNGSNKAQFSLDRINFNSGQYYVLNENNIGVILTNGQTSWGSQSDESLKENISDLGPVLDKVTNYRCVNYSLKATQSASADKIGFIAQDWESDFPNVVDADENGLLTMRYTETIPVLLKAIQEQQDLIESLTARIAQLEGAN